MIMPIPIPIHSSGGSEIEYVYPKWVEFIYMSALVLAVIGLVALCIVAILNTIDSGRFDITEKPFKYTFIPTLIGMVLLLIACVAMLLTGQPIVE